MKIGLYAIYDSVAKDLIGPIQMHKHDAVALRTFREILQLPNSAIAKNPRDYTLIRVGHVDAERPAITPDYQILAQADELLEAEQQHLQLS